MSEKLFVTSAFLFSDIPGSNNLLISFSVAESLTFSAGLLPVFEMINSKIVPWFPLTFDLRKAVIKGLLDRLQLSQVK